MKTRRAWMLSLTAGLMALAVLVGPAIAAELMGRVTAVNVEGKKLTVMEKDTDKEIEVMVNDDTILDRGEGKSGKADLEKMKGMVEKAKKGIPVVITHENKVASKITVKAGKKAEPKNN